MNGVIFALVFVLVLSSFVVAGSVSTIRTDFYTNDESEVIVQEDSNVGANTNYKGKSILSGLGILVFILVIILVIQRLVMIGKNRKKALKGRSLSRRKYNPKKENSLKKKNSKRKSK